MNAPLVIVTGFGPFLSLADNPSERVAKILEREPPPEIEVQALVLPVTFAGSKQILEEFLAQLPREPAALLGLGAHRGGFFRLERNARSVLDSAKPDNDGVLADQVPPLGERDRHTSIDLQRFETCLTSAQLEPMQFSNEAGGYVCERTYYALLEAGERLNTPALFLHVPLAEYLAPELQAAHVRELLTLLLAGGE